MIYTGLNKTGEVQVIHAHGGGTVGAVYGGINELNPIYYKSRMLTGTLPLSYKALSKPLTDYLISGNTLQDGTPTPSDPVDVVGCGVRTGNLFVSSLASGFSPNTGLTWAYDGSTLSLSGTAVGTGGRNTLKSSSFVLEAGQYAFTADAPIQLVIVDESTNTSIVSTSTITFTISDDHTVHVGVNVREANIGKTIDNKIGIMLNTGSTPLPYEPYGYKLPLTVNGTEYPIYLGQVETTRRIKKLVLTGDETENWNYVPSGGISRFRIDLADSAAVTELKSTHYVYELANAYGNAFVNTTLTTLTICHRLTTVDAFKTYLAAQYAAGTPVTIWYVLAEPVTSIVNEPLMKIGDYADTISMAQAGATIPTVSGANVLDMTSTVKPSEVSITGNIKPTATQ